MEEPQDLDEGILAVVAHGLLNPLSVVVGYNALVLERWEELDDEKRRYFIATALEGARLVAGILDDLVRGIPLETRQALDDMRAPALHPDPVEEGETAPAAGQASSATGAANWALYSRA